MVIFRKVGVGQPDTEDDIQSHASYANAKDGAGRPKVNEKAKVNLETILQEIQDFRHENKQHLDVIREDINNANQRIEEAEDRISATEAKLETMELIMRKVLKTQSQNDQKLIDQEARARRRNLRIFNVPENEEQGSTVTVFLEKFLREKLNLPDSPIYFDHDYPTAILNRRKEYNEAKRILREKKIRFQIPYPFKLRVFYEDETRIYHTAHEATKDMHDRGFTVRVVPPQRDSMELLDAEPWHVAGRRENDLRGPSGRQATVIAKLQAFRREPPH
ncbi:unnamed protein product [Leuciscus chuanchicus]